MCRANVQKLFVFLGSISFSKGSAMKSSKLQKLVCCALAAAAVLLVVVWLGGVVQAATVDPITGGLVDLDANRGVTLSGSNVSAWNNQVSGDNFSQGTAAYQPTFNSIAVNGQASLSFAQTSSGGYTGNNATWLAGTSNPWHPELVDGTGYTWFAVVNPGTQVTTTESPDEHAIIGDVLTVNPWTGFGDGVSDTGKAYSMYGEKASPNNNQWVYSTAAASGWTIASGTLSGTSLTCSVNGWSTGTLTVTLNAATSTGALCIGRLSNATPGTSTAEGYTGQIANVQIFDPLGTTAQNILLNNLAARYTIALSGSSPANGLYGGAASGYYFNVMGIGYTSATDLVTSSPGSGKSNGLVLSQLVSAPLTAAGQYLLAGDQNLVNSLVTPGDLPGGITSRWNQIWCATASGGIPGANFTFDFGDAGMTYSPTQAYTLLYRTDTSSTFTALGSSLTGGGILVGSDYQLTFGVNAPASGYYTLGLGTAVPEPGAGHAGRGPGRAALLRLAETEVK